MNTYNASSQLELREVVGAISVPEAAQKKEIERKYLLSTNGDSAYIFKTQEARLAQNSELLSARKVSFSGVDYYWISQDGKHMYRVRTGSPVCRRLGLKVKDDPLTEMCHEIEVDLALDADPKRAIDMLSPLVNYGFQSFVIMTKGLIRFVQYERGMIEVVLTTSSCESTGKQIVFIEIEAHDFESEKKAKALIFEWQERLALSEKTHTTLNSIELLR